MKFNVNKLNNWFITNTDEDVKKFILKFITLASFKTNNYFDKYEQKIYLFDTGCVEIENDDYDDDFDDFMVINLGLIKTLQPDLKKTILKILSKYFFTDDSSTEFMDSLLDELKIFIPYKDYSTIIRKQKLEKLHSLCTNY